MSGTQGQAQVSWPLDVVTLPGKALRLSDLVEPHKGRFVHNIRKRGSVAKLEVNPRPGRHSACCEPPGRQPGTTFSPPVPATGRLTVRKRRYQPEKTGHSLKRSLMTKVPTPQKVLQINRSKSLQRSLTEFHGPKDNCYSPKFVVVKTMAGLHRPS